MRKNKLLAKKAVAAVVSGLMVVGLAGCGGSGTPASSKASSISTSVSAEIDNGSLDGFAGKPVIKYSGYLGYGYNELTSPVYSEDYINASACVLDMNTLATNGLVYSGKLSKISTNYIFTDSYKRVLKAKAKESALGSEALFGGIFAELGIATADIIANSETKDNYFAAVSSEVQTSREYITTKDLELLKDNILEDFENYVAKNSAEDILKEYGAVVLTDVILGGRYDILYLYDSLEEENISLTTAGVSTYVDGVAKETAEKMELEGGTENEGDFIKVPAADKEGALTDFYKYTVGCGQFSEVLGGNAEIDISDFGENSEVFTKWAKTVADNAVVIDAKGGIPIWELIATFDTEKAEEVEAEYESQLEELLKLYKID